jgi:peptide/nickel transport system substrate-binding protein
MLKRGFGKKVVAAFLIAILVVSVVGCGPKEQTTGGAKDSLTIGIVADATTMDAQMFNDNMTEGIVSNIYDPIVRVTPDGEIVPCIAEKWEISEDGRVYTFDIKQGVKFHNGDELTLDDVVFTLNRCKESSFVGTYFSYIEDVKTQGDHQVVVTLAYPYSSFMPILACYSGVVSKKLLTEDPDSMARNPVGTGPYKFVKWEPENVIVMEAFEDYHAGAAPIKNVTFRIIGSASTGTISLQKGSIDAYVNVSSVDRQTVKDDENLELLERSSGAFRFLGINCEVKPFDDVRVRQAIAHAIDKEAVVIGAEDGNGVVAVSHIPEGVVGYDPNFKDLEHDVEKAKALLADAGYPEGFECTLTTTENRSMHAQIIQADLKKIGIDVKIELLESGTFYEDLENGDFELQILGWSYIAQDPDVAIYDLYKSDNALAGNYGRYANPKMDELLEKARVSTDTAERQKLYEEVEALCRDDAFNIVIYWTVANIGFNKDLRGVQVSPKSTYFVYPFHWADGE